MKKKSSISSCELREEKPKRKDAINRFIRILDPQEWIFTKISSVDRCNLPKFELFPKSNCKQGEEVDKLLLQKLGIKIAD